MNTPTTTYNRATVHMSQGGAATRLAWPEGVRATLRKDDRIPEDPQLEPTSHLIRTTSDGETALLMLTDTDRKAVDWLLL